MSNVIPSDEKLSQAFLRFMSRELEEKQPEKLRGEVGVLFRPETIRHFFERMREDSRTAYDPDPHPDSIVISEAERTAKVRDELAIVDEWEKTFDKWLKIDNPLAKLENDLKVRNCSKCTVDSFMGIARQYMKFCNFAPQFKKDELFLYLNELSSRNLSQRSIATHRTALKIWWDVLGFVWPLAGRRMHGLSESSLKLPPTFSESQIADLVKLVIANGTAEQRYYFCLATIYAPRPNELGNITAKNFSWDGDKGTLTFQTSKHGNIRIHSIPETLVPYLKDYSYEAEIIPGWKMVRLFHEWTKQIGFKVPKPPLRANPDAKGIRGREKGHGWHAFRHAVDTALLKAGASEIHISKWMGWVSNQSMVRYYAVFETASVDAEVLAKHPFIPFWENSNL